MLYTKDVDYYMDYLRNKMTKCACKYTEESHPSSSTLVLSYSTIQNTPIVTQKHQGVLEGRTFSI
jgi:hypothetical protein